MTDVVVIGCGAGGAAVAKELAEQGLEVVALEAGPHWENRRGPTEATRDVGDLDGTLLDEAWSGGYWDMWSPQTGKLRWGPADRSRPAWTRMYEGRALTIPQTAGVGGTTLGFTAIYPRAFAWDEPGLPFAELVPYYERVEAIHEVGRWEPIACKDELVIEAALRLGEDARIAPLAIRRGSYETLPDEPSASDFRAPGFSGCTLCGRCNVGCNRPFGAGIEDKAKRTANVTYVPAALRTGRFEVRPGCVARRIHAEDGVARAVTYRDPAGRDVTIEAPVVVLSAGAIESPRLWLNSGLPNGPRGDGPVGRYFMTHLFDYVGGLFPFDVDRFKGPAEASEVVLPGLGKLGALGGEPVFGTITSFGLNQGERVWGRELKRRMAEWRRSLSLSLIVDDEAHPDNRITLDRTRPPDEAGAIPRLRYVPTAETLRRRDALAARGLAILREAGAREDTLYRADPIGLSGHPMGTMRMGLDPATSVVDHDGAAHAVERLWIADNSVLPNSLGGANPTPTTQALATRTAERIAARHFGLSPWVSRRRPGAPRSRARAARG